VGGTYVVQLIVNDGTVDSPPDTVRIIVEAPPTISNLTVIIPEVLNTCQLEPDDPPLPNGSVFSYSYSYSDPNGDGNANEAQAITSPSSADLGFWETGEEGNGFTGQKFGEFCFRFNDLNSVDIVFSTSDGFFSSNSLSITISRPPGAN
jgi:hypothetical protein